MSDGIFILSPGSCPRGGLGSTSGSKFKFVWRSVVMLSPPKPLDQIQPNWVCELLTCMGRETAKKLAPPPGALGRGQKVKYHLISITKSISKILIPNFVYVLTNKRYKTYQT